jgi:hypothetical protein
MRARFACSGPGRDGGAPTLPADPPPPIPSGPDVVEIGWTWYAVGAQRTAVNTEAKLLLCTHAFERWRVRRVSWKTDARNARSRAAILRLGAQFDGILRAHRAAGDGTVRDSAFFSMLAAEWPAARQRLAEHLAGGLIAVRRRSAPRRVDA